MALSARSNNPMERPMLQSNDLSRSLAGLQELLRPGVIQALGDALAPAEFRDAMFATQAIQHNGDFPRLNIVCASLGGCPSRFVRRTFWGFRISGSSPLLDGYDEPEILPSSGRQICLTGADAGHP